MNEHLATDDRLWAIENAINALATLVSSNEDMRIGLNALQIVVEETIAEAVIDRAHGHQREVEKLRWQAMLDLLRPQRSAHQA